MLAIETAWMLLALATGVVLLAPRIPVPLEVLLLLASLLVSFVPDMPHAGLDPELVFLVFLPPILFAAAYFTSWRDFKANKRPISLLAIGLVLFTTLGVGAVLKWLLPEIPWAVGLILGAMVAPPDASAATSITRKLGAPRRLLTIIEGESLVNDSTALVAYKFAVAAVMTGVFSPWMAAGKFVWVGIGGVALGVTVGWTGIWLYRHVTEPSAQTLISFLTAFAAYLVGETAGASGVIATVTAGLYFGRWLPARGSAQVRIEAKAGWDLMLFIINAFVFTLIGFALPTVVRHLGGYSWGQLLLYAVVVNAAVIGIRFLWVFPATYMPRWIFPSLRRRDPSPPWSVVFVLSWTGMRGIVTLAAALALPTQLPDGSPFPYRALLVFLAYTVILTTLLLPSLTLPWLMRRLGVQADGEHVREEALARAEAIRVVLAALRDKAADDAYDAHQLDDLVRRYQRRLNVLEANLTDQAFSPLFDEDNRQRRLLRDVLDKEREALIRLRDDGKIHNEVVHLILRELDLEDLRLRTQRL